MDGHAGVFISILLGYFMIPFIFYWNLEFTLEFFGWKSALVFKSTVKFSKGSWELTVSIFSGTRISFGGLVCFLNVQNYCYVYEQTFKWHITVFLWPVYFRLLCFLLLFFYWWFYWWHNLEYILFFVVVNIFILLGVYVYGCSSEKKLLLLLLLL